MQTRTYGPWIIDHWEVVLGKFDGKILGCLCSTSLLHDWKRMLSTIRWCGDSSSHRNSLYQESIQWSAVFATPLVLQELVKTYNLSKLSIKHIDDVVDDQGQMLSFPQAMATHGLGLHHRPIRRKIWLRLEHPQRRFVCLHHSY